MSRKPLILWGFWPDELSARLEREFRLVFLEPEMRMAAIAPNYRIDRIVERLRDKGERPEAFFLHAWTAIDSLLGLDRLPIPSVAYLHDVHFQENGCDWDVSHAFDWVLLDHPDAPGDYVRRGARNTSTWCPLYLKLTRDHVRNAPPGRERPIDVAFVGNLSETVHPGRWEFFKVLWRRLGGRRRLAFGPGDYERIYPDAKIVINETWLGESPVATRTAWGPNVNFRVFEAMGSGALLLNDTPGPGLRALFREGVHFASYERGRADEAAGRIEHHLDREAERLRIAEAGWASVLESHTVEARADAIADTIRTVMESRGTLPKIDPAQRDFYLGRSYLRMVLAWRHRAPCMHNVHIRERLAEARRLLKASERLPRLGPLARSLEVLVAFLQGHEAEAAATWLRQLESPVDRPVAGRVLAALASRRDPAAARELLRRLGPEMPADLTADEAFVLDEILYRAFLEPAAGSAPPPTADSRASAGSAS